MSLVWASETATFCRLAPPRWKFKNARISLSLPPTRCYVCGDTLAEVSPSVRNNQTKWELMYSLHSDDPRKLLNSRCSTKFNMKKKREALPEREPSHIRRGEVEGFWQVAADGWPVCVYIYIFWIVHIHTHTRKCVFFNEKYIEYRGGLKKGNRLARGPSDGKLGGKTYFLSFFLLYLYLITRLIQFLRERARATTFFFCFVPFYLIC